MLSFPATEHDILNFRKTTRYANLNKTPSKTARDLIPTFIGTTVLARVIHRFTFTEIVFLAFPFSRWLPDEAKPIESDRLPAVVVVVGSRTRRYSHGPTHVKTVECVEFEPVFVLQPQKVKEETSSEVMVANAVVVGYEFGR